MKGIKMAIEMTMLERWIGHHEALRLFPYKCPADKLTIGYGRNLEDRGISADEAYYMLKNDIKKCQQELAHFDWYVGQPVCVQEALVNMCFNLGLPRLLGFKKMISALLKRDYTQAAIEALDSKWAKQVGNRAKDVAVYIRYGNRNESGRHSPY